MATALDAILAADAGAQLTDEQRTLIVRYVGGGGAAPGWFTSSGLANLDARFSPSLTLGGMFDRILANPALQTHYASLGTPQLAQEVSMGMNVVPGLGMNAAGELQLNQPAATPATSSSGGLLGFALLAWALMSGRRR